MKIEIGATITFCPGYRKDDYHGSASKITGRIVYINRAHRYFLVVAPVGRGYEHRECFKF